MEKILKKYIFVIILIIVLLVASGCSNNTNESSTGDNTSKGVETTQDSSDKSDKKTSEDGYVDVESLDFLASAEKQVAMPEKGATIAIMHVKDYGDIKIKFFEDVAPKAVENFVTHSKNGYYNGLTFHRVINDFMIQGGDPEGTGTGGESIWNKPFEDEFSYDLIPYRGAVCMANAGSNTNGSQFFVEQAKYNEETGKMLEQYGYPENLIAAYKVYGGSMHLFGAHTVFGQVIEGMDVVDKIAQTETGENDKPTTDVIIQSIEITQY